MAACEGGEGGSCKGKRGVPTDTERKPSRSTPICGKEKKGKKANPNARGGPAGRGG